MQKDIRRIFGLRSADDDAGVDGKKVSLPSVPNRGLFRAAASIEGYLARLMYGGIKAEASWKMIGFPVR